MAIGEQESSAKHRRFERVRLAGAVIVLLLVVFITGNTILSTIKGFFPYPQHIDEAFLTERAYNILKTNDWNPHYFNYSSFPVCLVTAAFSAGYLNYSQNTHERVPVDKIRSVAFPYYDPVSVVAPARFLFSSFVLIALIVLGVFGYWHFKTPIMLPLVPFLGYFSGVLRYQSTVYINVDVLAVCMTALVLLSVVFAAGSGSFAFSAVVPGILCGLAIASKYTYCWTLAPALLGIWLYGGKWKGFRSLVLMFSAAAAFLAVVPWAILDIRAFVDGLGEQGWEYAVGRPGQTYNPGWDHASRYLFGLINRFGACTVPLAFLGAVYAATTNARFAILLFSFPVLNVLHLSTSRLFYIRNALFLHVLYAFLLSAGILAVVTIVENSLKRVGVLKTRTYGCVVLGWVAAIVLALLLLPWGRHIWFVNRSADTRNQVTDWIKENVPATACIVTPDELGLDVGRLDGKYHVIERDFNLYTTSMFFADMEKLGVVYALMPQWAVTGKQKARAERKNSLAKYVFPLVQYDGQVIDTAMPYPLSFGNPALSLNLIIRGSNKLDENLIRNMSALSMYDVFQTGEALKNAFPAPFRNALEREFAQNTFPRRPVSPELDFIDMDIRRIDGNNFDFRFMFFVNEHIEKDLRFFFCLSKAEENAQKPPEEKKKIRTRRWDFDPQPPTSQWQLGRYIVISMKKPAAGMSYELELGFFLNEGTHYGSAISLGETNFSKL